MGDSPLSPDWNAPPPDPIHDTCVYTAQQMQHTGYPGNYQISWCGVITTSIATNEEDLFRDKILVAKLDLIDRLEEREKVEVEIDDPPWFKIQVALMMAGIGIGALAKKIWRR